MFVKSVGKETKYVKDEKTVKLIPRKTHSLTTKVFTF